MLEKIQFGVRASKNASGQLHYLQRLGPTPPFPWKGKEHGGTCDGEAFCKNFCPLAARNAAGSRCLRIPLPSRTASQLPRGSTTSSSCAPAAEQRRSQQRDARARSH